VKGGFGNANALGFQIVEKEIKYFSLSIRPNIDIFDFYVKDK